MTGLKEHTLEEYGVDREDVLRTAKILKDCLDAKVDACNKDPKFRHPVLSGREGYLPIHTYATSINFSSGSIHLPYRFEPGNGLSTSGHHTYFYPNLLKFLYFLGQEVRPEWAEKIKSEWLAANPNIDLTKYLFETSELVGKRDNIEQTFCSSHVWSTHELVGKRERKLRMIVSNDMKEMLDAADRTFEALAKTREPYRL